MSEQVSVQSIEALKEFRVVLGMYSEETMGALGGISMECKRLTHWLQQDRRNYWEEQIKRRREKVAMARSEVARRRLAKTSDYTPAYSEQKELLRQAEASLRDAEVRATMVKKWEPVLQHAILELRASTRRIDDLAGGDIPRAMLVLERMVDALEAYLRVTPAFGSSFVPKSVVESIAETCLAEEPAAEAPADGDPAPPDADTPESEPPTSPPSPDPTA